MIDGGKALAGCLLFIPASSVTKPLASCSLLHGACAGAVYRGPYPFAEARATILKFALPVLRQGDLPLLLNLGLPLSAFLWKRRAGTAFLLFFLQKA